MTQGTAEETVVGSAREQRADFISREDIAAIMEETIKAQSQVAATRAAQLTVPIAMRAEGAHWGNTDFGRILAAGGLVLGVCLGIAALILSVACLTAVLRA
jgi:hypothetical protein